jgi:hypothetical protein
MSVRMKLCVGDELAWRELAFLTVVVASINGIAMGLSVLRR